METARDRYAQVVHTPSDIRDHLPRLRLAARGTVLELGVRGGNSTAALLAGVEERGGSLWSVDIDAASAAVFAGHPQWHFVLADSRDSAAVDEAGLPTRVDVLFVDTIHTYEQVRDELAVWGDRVGPDGRILFHDTDSYSEIRPAIAEWCRARRVPYEYFRGSSGLGVAYLDGSGSMRIRKAVVRGVRRVAEIAVWLARLPRRVLRRLRREIAQRRLRGPS